MTYTTLIENEYKQVLVTGSAGFIGFHFTKKLLSEGWHVTSIDNINSYYDVELKYSRLKQLGFSQEQIDGCDESHPISPVDQPNLIFYRADLKERDVLTRIFEKVKPFYVVNLAAQVGVRYSIENPYAYVDSNLTGFMNILENCRHHHVKHLVLSSSSSVYGANRNMPYSEHQNVDHPISLYAATKKANELMAHSYAHLYKLPVTGLRFFTVYGPWGRPDMAYFDFTKKILGNMPIDVFNNGKMKRDFTYVDDIVEGIYRILLRIPQPSPDWDEKNPDSASSCAPYRIFNIGNHQPVDLLYFIECIEECLGKKARKNFLPLQKGDVLETYADIDALNRYTGFIPRVTIEEGIERFVKWYLEYYKGNSDESLK